MIRRLPVLLLGGFLACGTGTGPGDPGEPDSPDVAAPPVDAASPGDAARDPGSADLSAGDTAADSPAPAATPFPWTVESTAEACGNGRDDDGNGYADCLDFACSRNPAVFGCKNAVYEVSPAACGDGKDNDGDGLADCADPDCADNPFHDACPEAPFEHDCAGTGDTDQDGLAGCADSDCRVRDPATCPPAAGSLAVLFDQSVDETAALGPNSDWVVDGLGRFPSPSDPSAPDDWHGGLSCFAFDLWKAGHRVQTLPSATGRLTWQDAGNPQDLSRYQVLVLVEPSRAFSPAEGEAVVAFVRAGGGLLAVANHDGADRDGNGWSAPRAWNGVLDRAGDPFGFRFDAVDVDVADPLDRVLAPDHPVLQGAAGKVQRIGFYSGCAAHLTGTNPAAVGLIQLPGASGATDRLAVGAAEAGKGRVVFVTDSALANDGTDSHGNRDPGHDSWRNTALGHRALFLNAVDWLGRVGGK